jgi:hypothetical protein
MKKLLLAVLFFLPLAGGVAVDLGVLDAAASHGGVQAEEETSEHAVLLPAVVLSGLPDRACPVVQTFSFPAEPELAAPPAPPDERRA